MIGCVDGWQCKDMGNRGKTNGRMEETTYNFSLSLGELGLGILELLSLSLPDVLRLLGLLSLAITSGEGERGGKGQQYAPR